jgi:CDGSH-type Zn-finger protein
MSKESESSKITIELMQDGPIIVRGLVRLVGSQSQEIPVTTSAAALCRCGASGNKPFCDGSHKNFGFSGDRLHNKPLDQEKSYRGQKITIHDNRRICSHAAECVTNLSSVFQLNKRPWIDTNGASAEEIIAVIKKCPSGALNYSIDGVRHVRNFGETEIRIAQNGPYNVNGRTDLLVDDALQPPVKENYALCRCGASQNKPYCDGTHREIEFKG